MANDYYNPNNEPQDGARGIAAIVRNVFTLISQGFDKLPALARLWGGSANYAADTGAADAYVVSIASTYLTSYSDGLTIRVKIANANTGASTINVNALGARTIVRGDGSALQAGDLVAGQIVELAYNSTAGNFQLNASAAAASASAAAASAAAAAGSAGAAAGSAGAASGSAGAAAASAGAASGSASAAAQSAIDAAAFAAALVGTSTTSVLIATGSKSFTTGLSKQWSAGQFISVASAANTANYMHGQVASYNPATGALDITVTDIGGSGTFADWNIAVSGTQGTSGSPGLPMTFINTNTAATVGNHYVLTAACTLTYPASPTATNQIEVTVLAGVVGAIVNPNGKLIRDTAGSMTVDFNPFHAIMNFSGDTHGWI